MMSCIDIVVTVSADCQELMHRLLLTYTTSTCNLVCVCVDIVEGE